MREEYFGIGCADWQQVKYRCSKPDSFALEGSIYYHKNARSRARCTSMSTLDGQVSCEKRGTETEIRILWDMEPSCVEIFRE